MKTYQYNANVHLRSLCGVLSVATLALFLNLIWLESMWVVYLIGAVTLGGVCAQYSAYRLSLKFRIEMDSRGIAFTMDDERNTFSWREIGMVMIDSGGDVRIKLSEGVVVNVGKTLCEHPEFVRSLIAYCRENGVALQIEVD